MTVQDLVVQGVRLCVDVTGTSAGRPLVLIHGLGLDKTTWTHIAPAFAATHRVVTVDMRGFGDSDRPGEYSYQAMRDDTLGLLDQVGTEQVDLIGHSMGGTVAWLVAQCRPDRIAHLVVEDAPPPRPGARPLRTPPAEPPTDAPFDWQALLAITAQAQHPDPAWWQQTTAVTGPDARRRVKQPRAAAPVRRSPRDAAQRPSPPDTRRPSHPPRRTESIHHRRRALPVQLMKPIAPSLYAGATNSCRATVLAATAWSSHPRLTRTCV